MSRAQLLESLAPLVDTLRGLDAADPGAADLLAARHPLAELAELAALVRSGVEEGWLCDREGGGVRFSRVAKAGDPATAPLSLDAVHMSGPGPGHTHPQGEFDLAFAVSGEPTFDGRPPGWTVYPPGSWHVPTVAGGVMDILYFLPDGAMRFEPRPA